MMMVVYVLLKSFKLLAAGCKQEVDFFSACGLP